MQLMTGKNAEQIKKDKKLNAREYTLFGLIFSLPMVIAVVIFSSDFYSKGSIFQRFKENQECHEEAKRRDHSYSPFYRLSHEECDRYHKWY